MEDVKQEINKRPIWKTILVWIVGIWAILTLAGAVIEIFMFFTVGAEITIINISVWLLALAIALKLGMIKYTEGNEKKFQEKKEGEILENTSPRKIKYLDDKNYKNENLLKLDIVLKVSIIIGIILVAIALFYYFLIRPKQEEQAYADCLSALSDNGKFNANTAYGKSALDVCTKSRGAEKIRTEKEQRDKQEELSRQQEEAARQTEEAIQKEKELMPIELSNLSIENIKTEWRSVGSGVYFGGVNFKGKIKNNNGFDVNNIKVKIEIFSHNDKKNKIDEKEFLLSDVFYAKSTKDFAFLYDTGTKDGFNYSYKITGAKTDAAAPLRFTAAEVFDCSKYLKNSVATIANCDQETGDEKTKCESYDKKLKGYCDLVEIKSKTQMTLKNQLTIIDSQQASAETELQKTQQQKLLEMNNQEELKYKYLMEEVEQQKKELFSN